MNSSCSVKMYGLILARKNSKGIPNKNVAIVDGVPLIVSAIRTMKNSDCFEAIYVSTDGANIESLSAKEGAIVHQRAAHTATDEASSLLAVQEFLHSNENVDNLCLVQCTSPFLNEKYLQEGRDLFASSDWDSVFAVTRKRQLRWSEEVPCTPLNFDPRNRIQRQSLPGELCENGMFYFCSRKFVMEGLLQGGRCNYVEIPEEDSLDIDTPLDLFLAQEMMKFKKIMKSINSK